MRGLASFLSLVLVACGASPPAGRGEPEPEAPTANPIDPPTATTPAPADRAQRVADLELLCSAVDHDYVDGTLSDYYAKVTPTTEWGRARLREGEESITPGRLLQKAATELNLAEAEAPGCRKLFDVLDELE